MENPTAVLEAIAGDLAGVVDFDGVGGLTDEALLHTAGALERVGRVLAAGQVAVAAEVAERSRKELGSGGLAAKKGCRTANELLERVTRASGQTVSTRVRVGRATRARTSLIGQRMPAEFPSVAEALGAGELGLDSAQVIVRGLSSVSPVADPVAVLAGEAELVEAATGTTPKSPFPCTAEDTRVQTSVWKAFLDQDGTLPAEQRALRLRGLRVGHEHEGLVSVRGGLLPDVAAKFLTLLDAYTTPRTAPAFLREEELAAHDVEHDPRTRDQQAHDIFAGILDSAARAADTPTLGGAAPLVMVSVRQADLDKANGDGNGFGNGGGVGFIDRTHTTVSMRTVTQYTCNGGTQRVVFDEEGRIIELGAPQRCFTSQQRRAIALRDGGCSVPGCHIPAAWCEIHHVDPAENGGPTHTDNGVMLCWFHHRTLDTSGWEFQMHHGTPYVKAPPWLDHTAQWRPTRGSQTQQLNALEKTRILQE